MILADTIAIFLSVLGVLMATNALWLFNQAIWPDHTRKAGELMIESPWKSFFLGVPIVFLTVFLVGVLSKLGKGPAELMILVSISLFFLFASVGVSGYARQIGEKLSIGGNVSWKQCCFGGVVLELVFLLPILGWVIVFPIATITGCGALLRAFLHGRKKESASLASSGATSESQVAGKNV